jgi:ATP-dependent helicase YprA (DUF1998 family)
LAIASEIVSFVVERGFRIGAVDRADEYQKPCEYTFAFRQEFGRIFCRLLALLHASRPNQSLLYFFDFDLAIATLCQCFR